MKTLSLHKNRPILKNFTRSLQRFPLETGDKILVAVSGGPDSVCLLHLLRQLASSRAFTLHVAHLDHGFRPEAGREADFVERLCNEWEIPITRSALPVPRLCKERRLSNQEGARQIRYEFLKKVAEQIGARWIALGHTADDQAETFLMRLLRGAGSQGLGGIPRMRDGIIIRPLLKTTRQQILEELSRERIPFVEDPSNRQEIYLRNRVRHRLLPLLEEYNPKLKETFSREAALLQEENEFLNQYTEELLPRLGFEIKEGEVALDIDCFKALHPALQRRIIRWSLDQLHPGLKGIGFKHVETILTEAVPGPVGNVYSLPYFKVERGYTQLFLRKVASKEMEAESSLQTSPSAASFSLAPGSIDLPEWGLRLIFSLHRNGEVPFAFSTCAVSFDFDKISTPLTLRGWQPGDFFFPAGMGGKRKKLQDLFTDAKIPKSRRDSIPLLTSPDGIVWVVGLRADDRFLATERTTEVLKIEAQALNRSSFPSRMKPFPAER